MKKLLFLSVVMVLLSSCSKDDDPSTSQPNAPKEYVVSLGVSGEITNVTESPLEMSEKSTKIENTDIYGFQIYSAPATGGEYKAYANGLFDDKTNISIKLIEGYKYKFVCSMIVDGKNKLKYNFFISGDGKFSSITNVFEFSSTNYMILYGGSLKLYLNDDKDYYRPNIDRYYGEYSDYIPTDNGVIQIPIKRVSFGAKFMAEGLTEGKLKISIQDAPIFYLEAGTEYIEDIFSLKGNAYNLNQNDWTADSYFETVPVSIMWVKTDGAEIPLANKDISFKRNTLTSVTIKVSNTSVDGDIGLVQETKDMSLGEEVLIDVEQ